MNTWWKIAAVLLVLIFLGLIARARGLTLRIRDISGLLPRGQGSYSTRDLSQIKTIVIHHSASENQDAFDYATYHINSHGWPGIGYHFVIDPDGTINQTNDLKTISYHVAGYNTQAVGICLSGNLNHHPMTREQRASLTRLIRRLRLLLPKVNRVAGHREFGSTDCPGEFMEIGDFD